jgi:hypothetical protein
MIPKLEKCTKWTEYVPDGHRTSQMYVKYYKWPFINYISIIQSEALQKFTQIGIFGSKIKPSGNPCVKDVIKRYWWTLIRWSRLFRRLVMLLGCWRRQGIEIYVDYVGHGPWNILQRIISSVKLQVLPSSPFILHLCMFFAAIAF